MIIIPNNPAKKGPVILSGIYNANSVTTNSDDLLLYTYQFVVSLGYNLPIPSGFTRLTPNPQFTNANHAMGWKIAGVTGSGINISNSGFVLVFKNGMSIGGYGVTSLTWTDPAQPFWEPSISLKNKDGSSYLLSCSGAIGAATGYSVNLDFNNGYYPFYQNPNSEVSSSGGVYRGYANQGMIAIIEIANT